VLTVLLATRNRSRILEQVLASFCQLRAPESGWKLAVVDNGSTDGTSEIIRSFAQRLPLEIMFEPGVGKNTALNTGLAAVEGDLVVFTDDDVFPRADWLIELRRAADTQPQCAIFGGPVLPRWEVPPPRWVHWVEQSPAFAVTEPSLTAGIVSPRLVYGPNMALRANLFSSEIRFNHSMGPCGENYAQGGEMELIIRLSRGGHRAWYVPNAPVEHLIRKEQLKKSWVMQRAVRFGRGEFRLGFVEANKEAQQSSRVRTELRQQLLREALRIVKATMLLRRERAFRCLWRFHFLQGQIMELRSLAREHRFATRLASTDT
jgi:glycosyltransferase involved in cell wall biosynthesis